MYAILNNQFQWTRASPRAAAELATATNGGRVVSPAALRALPDSLLVAMGVRRLDDYRPPEPPQKYQRAVRGDIVVNNLRCTQEWSFVDEPLEVAKSIARATIAAQEAHAYTYPIELFGYRFTPDENIRNLLNSLGNALASGNAYVDTRFRAVHIASDELRRPTVNQANFMVLTAAVAAHDRNVNAYSSILEANLEAATDLDAIRALNLESGWPNQPEGSAL